MSNSATRSMSSQQRLFNEILIKYPSKSGALSELCALLQMTKTSLYRRINGSTALKLNEVILLTKQYKLSLDELMNNPSSIYTFQYLETNQIAQKEITPISDIDLLEDLQKVKNPNLAYLGSQIPVFYLHLYPSLIYFKEHLWRRNNTIVSQKDYTPIDFNAITNEDISRYQQYWNLYSSIPSDEIWDSNGLTLLVEQIRHYYEIGLLSEDNLELLKDKLHKLVDRIAKMLRVGSKHSDEERQNLSVFHNYTLLPTWFFIAESDSLNYFQGAFNPPNALVSHNKRMINTAKLRFRQQKERTTAIARQSGQHRTRLLNLYRRNIESLDF